MTHAHPPHDPDDAGFDGRYDGSLDDLFADASDEAASGDASLDEDFPLGDGVAEIGAIVLCPYCGEPNEVALDPGGGERQSYVEDCQVCCRPWEVRVTYHADGSADVQVDAADGE